MRISKVTTKKGDKGASQLSDGTELPKSDLIFDCLGDLDELNAIAGWVESASDQKWLTDELHTIQNDLFNIGGELATPNPGPALFNPDRIQDLEALISDRNESLPPLKEFILPGGTELQSRVHLMRAVCRRTERRIARFLAEREGAEAWLIYLNRLSDYLFVLARWINREQSTEKQWENPI